MMFFVMYVADWFPVVLRFIFVDCMFDDSRLELKSRSWVTSLRKLFFLCGVQFVHLVEELIQVDLQADHVQFLVLLAPLDPDKVVILQLIHAAKELRVVHPRHLDLAAHHVNLIEHLSVLNKFFLTPILKQASQGFQKHQILSRLASQSASNFRPMFRLIHIKNGLIGHSNLRKVTFEI